MDAFARQDPRTAELLAGATDLAGAMPVGQPAVGATLTYALPVPRDFRYVYADFDGSTRPDDPIAVEHRLGATQVTVVVDVRSRRFVGLRVDVGADVTTYDAQGNVLGSSLPPEERSD